MTEIAIGPGCVLHWDGFKLHDGSDGHKFFVIVGAKPDCNFLAIIATSQKKWNRKYIPGCDHETGWYHIPGNGKDFFEKDTWLLFGDPQELKTANLLQLRAEKKLEIKGLLRPDIANGIMNCMRKCEDVSAHQISLLGPSIQPPKKT